MKVFCGGGQEHVYGKAKKLHVSALFSVCTEFLQLGENIFSLLYKTLRIYPLNLSASLRFE